MADEEINEMLPDLESKFNAAIAKGEAFMLDVASIFKGMP